MNRLSDSIRDDFASIVDDLEKVTVRQWKPGGATDYPSNAKRVPLRNTADPARTRGGVFRVGCRWLFPRRETTFEPQPADVLTDSKRREYVLTYVTESAMTGVVRADAVDLRVALPATFDLYSLDGSVDQTGATRAKFTQVASFAGRLVLDAVELTFLTAGRQMEEQVRILATYQAGQSILPYLTSRNYIVDQSDPTKKYDLTAVETLNDLEGFVSLNIIPSRVGDVHAG